MNNNEFEEGLKNPLEKYGRDICALAKDGKIDPVIGRDDEVRSITRILSERRRITLFLLVSQVLVRQLLLKGLHKELLREMFLVV